MKIELREKICAAADEIFSLDPGSVGGRSRQMAITPARKALFWALYQFTGSYKGTGNILGFDHTSIMWGVKSCIQMQSNSRAYAEHCRILGRRLFEIEGVGVQPSMEAVIREMVKRTTVEAMEPELWKEKNIFQSFLVDACKPELAKFDPKVHKLVPISLSLDRQRYIARFESTINRGNWDFKLMDYEKVGI